MRALAAAFLDSRLEKLIRKKVIGESKTVQQFLSFNGAAGTFSSRIDFCYLIGLIPKSVQADLHLIRKIRNEFGHRVEPLRFVDPEICSRCELFQNTCLPKEARPRLKFTNACFGVLSVIDVATIETKEFESPVDNFWSQDEKDNMLKDIHTMFNGALDKLSPGEIGAPEGKAKMLKDIIGGIIDSGDLNDKQEVGEQQSSC